MAAPIGLTVKNNLADMQVGDCIPCRYTATTSGVAGYFSELGTCTETEIPLTGTATPDGLFYLIKTDKGTLIADRVIQTNISWDALNDAKLIEGSKMPCSPQMTSNEDSNYKIIFSSEMSIFYKAYFAFGGKETYQTWSTDYTKNITTGYLGIQYKNAPEIVAEYSITMHGKGIEWRENAYPKNWTFEGSSDGVNWTVLDTQTNQSQTLDNVEVVYKTTNTNAYSYYRINISANNGASDYVAISELKFYNSIKAYIRSLSGGVAYLDTNGNSSTTDKSLGAWPSNNEWDKYIVNDYLKGKIIPGDDNIWHWNLWCYSKETPILNIKNLSNVPATTSYRSLRGYSGDGKGVVRLDYTASTYADTYGGFRPVLNYIESDIASEVIY